MVSCFVEVMEGIAPNALDEHTQRKVHMSDSLRILVIDDNAAHRQSAIESLAGHEITVIDSFDALVKLIEPYWDSELKQIVEPPFPYDAVLTDMLMPMSKRNLAENYNPEVEMPYGYVIALLVARRGARFVAMLTDASHHHHAMAATIDLMGPYSCYEKVEIEQMKIFTIDGAKVTFIHAPMVTHAYPNSDCNHCKQGECTNCNGTGTVVGYGYACSCAREDQKHRKGKCFYCHGTRKYTKKVDGGKDWGRILNALMTGTDVPTIVTHDGGHTAENV